MAMASARFLSLFPLLLHYRSSSSSLHLLRRLNHATFHLNAIFPSHFLPPLTTRSFHPQSSIQSHPLKSEEPHEVSWPEWVQLVNWISTSGFCNGSLDYAHEYVEQDLPLDFLRNANACLDFAQKYPNLVWSLPRGEIEVVIHFCSPFLFKDALGATRRMRSYLGIGLNDVLESDKPSTIDLMRFLLSYAHLAFFSSEDKPMNNKVESSVRKLLGELVNTRGVNKDFDASVPNQFDERHGQAPVSLGKSVQMQRGDWMCPRCNFMNFSKNLKCRDCEEPLPEKHITSREWECPQCNFFNFGRNAVCLRGDCKKAEIKPSVTVKRQQEWISKTTQLEKSYDMTNSVEISKYLDEALSQTSTTDASSIVKVPEKDKSASEMTKKEDIEEPEKSDRWFRKVSEVYDGDDKDFPETMPMRKGENRFVVSKKKDRSLTSPMYKRRMAMEQNPGNTNNYVPFVPFPPDYFSKPEEKEELDSRASFPDNNNNNNTVSNSGLENKVLERKSLEGSAVKEPDPLDMSEEAKAERWFRRVAQIKNISELSEIPDEDFPSIMPMRKGMNRFVVSKRKTPFERRLTSSQYQRRNIQAVNPDIVKKETDSN